MHKKTNNEEDHPSTVIKQNESKTNRMYMIIIGDLTDGVTLVALVFKVSP